MGIAVKQAAHAIADDLLRLPGDFPSVPDDIVARFPDTAPNWQEQQQQWWTKTQNSLSEFAGTVQDGIAMGNVLTVDGDAGSIYIRNIRGEGKWADPDTPFYVNRSSYFSLGSALTWNPETKTLMISGTIIAIAGTIGGFSIGADYIRDTANSFGLSSTVTGGNDVRFWAGSTFANRNTAPLRFYEDGTGVIAGFTIGATALTAGTAPAIVTISTVVTAGLTVGDPTGLRSIVRAGLGGTSASFYLYNASNALVGSFETQSTHEGPRLFMSNTAGTKTIDIDIDSLVSVPTITITGTNGLITSPVINATTSADIVGFAYSAGRILSAAGKGLDYTTLAGGSELKLGNTGGEYLNLRKSSGNTLGLLFLNGATVKGSFTAATGAGSILNINDSAGNVVVSFDGNVAGGAPTFGVYTAGVVVATGSVAFTDSAGNARQMLVL